MRTRPLPQRKSLGTSWNLRPDTERVQGRELRVGDVVMEDREHPAVVVTVSHPHPHPHHVRVHVKYIWQEPWERTWILGTFETAHTFHRAIPGEY